MAGMAEVISSYCNRVFASLVSCIEADAVNWVVTIPFHGFEVGSQVKFSSSGDYTETLEIIDRTTHTFTVANVIEQVDVDLMLSDPEWVSVRPVRTMTLSTNGYDRIALFPRPVAEVVSLTIDGVTIDPSEYGLADIDNGLSFIGEVVLGSSCYPEKGDRDRQTAGATVEFVSGEAFPPIALQSAMLYVLKVQPTRQGQAAYQSQSMEYYSYSKMSGADVGSLLGESEFAIKRFRLPTI
jgi:hypothetical protein